MYEQAKNKVENSATLSLYSEFILADWPEGEDHWQWVVDSDEDEILEWAMCEGELD